MQPLFHTCVTWLDENRFATVIRNLPELVRLAGTPEELVVAARAAAVSARHLLELKLLRRATAEPDCPPAGWNRLAGFYVGTGQFLLAEELLRPRLEDASWRPVDRAWGLLALAGSMAGRRRFVSAARLLEEARAAAPAADAELAVQLGYVEAVLAYSKDRWEEAEARLTGLVDRAPAESRFYQLLARCREHLHRPEAALEALEAGVAALPEHPALWMATAALAWTLGRHDLAEPATARFQELLDRPRFRRTARMMARVHTEPAVRLKVPPVRQGHNHCFPACIAMVKGYWGQPEDHRTVGAAVMEGTAGTPLFRALAYLEAGGWQVRAFRATQERLKGLIDRGVPSILGLEFAGGAHVHICTGYADWGFILQDPASIHPRGLRMKGFDPVYAHSDYWALAFVPADRAGLLDCLPADDDAQIRQIQRCWEALGRSDLDGARAELAALPWDKPSTGLRLLALRVWPRLTERDQALEAARTLLELHADDADIRTEIAEHLERLGEAEQACTVLKALPGRPGTSALMILGRAAADPEAAVARFRAAALSDPDNPEPLAEWGRALLHLGQLEPARACFEAAVEMDDRPAYRADLADMCLREGDAAGAVAAFRAVLKRERRYPWAWWRRGEAHQSREQWRSALRCMQIAAAQAPEDAHFLERLALASERWGRVTQAMEMLRQSPLLERSADLQSALAGIGLNRGALEEALAVARLAMERFPDDARFPPMVAEALRRLDQAPEGRAVLAAAVERMGENAWVRARYGRYLVLTGEVTAGLEQVKQARDLAPDLTDPLEWLLRAAGGSGHRGAVLAYLEGEAEAHPWLWGRLAPLWGIHDQDRALSCAERALAYRDRTPAALAEYGHVALDLERFDAAHSAFADALEADPATARACYGMALLARSAEDVPGQAEWLRKAVFAATDREEARPYADELAEWYEANDLPGLGAFLDSIAGRVPEAWRLTYIGYWHELSGRPAEALACFDRASAHDAGLIWPHYRRPLALLATGQKEAALEAARTAVARWPHEAGLPWLTGHCLAALGQAEEAAGIFRQVLHRDPEHGSARHSLWELYQNQPVEQLLQQVAEIPAEGRARVIHAFGEKWRREGNTQKAAAAYAAAMDLDAAYPDPLLRLSHVARIDGDHQLAWERAATLVHRAPGYALDYVKWLAGETLPKLAATFLARAADSLTDADRFWRAEYRALQAARHIDAFQWEESLAAWRQVAADNPRHLGALRRISDEQIRWRRYHEVLPLLEGLLEEQAIPATEPRLLANAITAALALGRPRRPHWRAQVHARLRELWAEGGSAEEWALLHRLWERLDLDFGNLRGARRARVVDDGLANWVRTGVMALVVKLRRPPLDIRPGESAEPLGDPYPPMGYRASGGPAVYRTAVACMDRVGHWVRGNLVGYFLLMVPLMLSWAIRSDGGDAFPLELVLWGAAGLCALLPRWLWSVRKVTLDA